MDKQTAFGRNFGHHFGQKLGKKLGKEIGRKGEALGQKFDERVEKIAETVNTAAQTAKSGLDNILLNLEHRGLNLKESQELIQKVGQTVLDRAERIRSQIAEHPSLGPIAPSWLREPLLKNETSTAGRAHATSDAAGSMTEATVSEAAEEMQTETLADEQDEASPKKSKSAKGKTARASSKN